MVKSTCNCRRSRAIALWECLLESQNPWNWSMCPHGDAWNQTEVEIFGFLNNSVMTHDVFLDAVLWEGMQCFAKSRHLRGPVMFRKNINRTPQTERGCSCMAASSLLYWSSLVFAGLHWSHFFASLHFIEKSTLQNFSWYSGWFWLATSTALCGFGRALLFLLDPAEPQLLFCLFVFVFGVYYESW